MDTESLHKQLYATPGSTCDMPLQLIAINGPDAQEFLQGQLTLDLSLLKSGQHQMTAWCNAKGRVWCLLRIWRQDDGFALLLPHNQAEAFVKRLRMFVLRAKVTVDALDHTVLAQIGHASENPVVNGVEFSREQIILQHDAQHRLILVPKSEHVPDVDATLRYTALRILAGEAQIDANTQEKFLPQSLGLGELGGLHFNKGCYVGQEIVARVHYRGKAPQKLMCGLDLSADERAGKAVLAEISTPAGQLVQWVENIKS